MSIWTKALELAAKKSPFFKEGIEKWAASAVQKETDAAAETLARNQAKGVQASGRVEPTLDPHSGTTPHTSTPSATAPRPADPKSITPTAEELKILHGHDARVTPRAAAVSPAAPHTQPAIQTTVAPGAKASDILKIEGARAAAGFLGGLSQRFPRIAATVGAIALVPAGYFGYGKVLQMNEMGDQANPVAPGVIGDHFMAQTLYTLGYDFSASNGSDFQNSVEMSRMILNPGVYMKRFDDQKQHGWAPTPGAQAAYDKAKSDLGASFTAEAAPTVKAQEAQAGISAAAANEAARGVEASRRQIDQSYVDRINKNDLKF